MGPSPQSIENIFIISKRNLSHSFPSNTYIPSSWQQRMYFSVSMASKFCFSGCDKIPWQDNNLGETGLMLAQDSSSQSIIAGKTKQGSEAAGHVTPTVESREKWIHAWEGSAHFIYSKSFQNPSPGNGSSHSNSCDLSTLLLDATTGQADVDSPSLRLCS